MYPAGYSCTYLKSYSTRTLRNVHEEQFHDTEGGATIVACTTLKVPHAAHESYCERFTREQPLHFHVNDIT